METGFVLVLEWFTVLVSLMVIFSGLPACVKMYKSRSTKHVPFVLFLVYAFISTLCLQYAFVIENTAMMLVNAVGLLVWIGYISVYFLITQNKAGGFLRASAVLFLYWAHLQYMTILPKERVLPTLGSYMVFWCTVVAVLPCADIVEMVKTKNTSCCDLSMLSATTLSSLTWIMYSTMIKDYNILFSSVPAIIVNSIKFVCIFMYFSSKPKKIEEKTNGEIDISNGHITTGFHEQIYKVKARNSLRKVQ